LRAHLGDAPLSPEIDLEKICGKYKFSGGQIARITERCALFAAVEGTENIEHRHLIKAFDNELKCMNNSGFIKNTVGFVRD